MTRNTNVWYLIAGLSEGKHGFHIHEFGADGPDCTITGGHYNPEDNQHGGPDSDERHVGDLGNIDADAFGNSNIKVRRCGGYINTFASQCFVFEEKNLTNSPWKCIKFICHMSFCMTILTRKFC